MAPQVDPLALMASTLVPFPLLLRAGGNGTRDHSAVRPHGAHRCGQHPLRQRETIRRADASRYNGPSGRRQLLYD